MTTLNADQAAEYLGIGRSTIYKLSKAGQIPAVNLGGRWVWIREKLEEFMMRKAEENVISTT
jgi:excisionase family DNA binding protein